MPRFVHLHTHSHYSLLEALPKVKALLGHMKAQGMDAVALTDNGALYGAIEFYQKAMDEGIKPIIGMDAYVARHGDRRQKRARIDAKPFRLVLLAQNNEGYRNLLKLSSIGFLEGFYYKPRVDKEVLRAHAAGLIALSGGHTGELDELLKRGARDEAVASLREYQEIFGAENFYLELVDRPEIAEQEAANAALIAFGREHNAPIVATKNTFYLRPTDMEAWKILNCIKGGKTLEDFDRMNQFESDASMVSGEYMEKRFADVPEAIENTRAIADRCNLTLELGKWNFADFKIPDGKTFRQVLEERVWNELSLKVKTVTEEMKKRAEYEIGIIDQKGFCPYFLIVSDFIEWARAHGIVTTTRGSVAGSIVSFAIGISTIDPMHYQLPFERFLNPERPSAPDVDADFADNRRDEVLEYVRGKYGQEKVAQICTFGTMLARGSVRDVGRALGFPYDFVDKIAKQIPMGSQGFPMTLARALEETEDLKKMYDTDAHVHRVIDVAKTIEGCARHVSIHAAGTVVAPSALTDFTPLQIDTREGKIITQYEMKSVEAAGLVKMDFLGIRNLSILGDAIALVNKLKNACIVLERIPVDDKKTFDLLARGYTMGVFQLGGDGMTKYLMELKPSRVQDIMAMVALYRPGPIESIPEYIRRKHDPSKVSFLDPRMEKILDQSYGVIVYQDDVMLIAIHLAGYSWLEADKLRKAMGKKIPEEMAKQKVKLLDGLIAHGMHTEEAQELWKLIEPFAAYGFNKAHAASYGMVAYQTAYMKANYPSEYMTSLMTAESGDLEKIAEAVKECTRLGIQVLPPDINASRKMFTYIDDETIRFGLLVIKNLGEEVVESMIAERERGGAYKDLADFVSRISHRAFNKKSLEALIKAGALDRFGERNSMLQNMDRILLFHKAAVQAKTQNQGSLFTLSSDARMQGIALRETSTALPMQSLAWEKEALGLYVSAHPFADVQARVAPYVLACVDLPGCRANKRVRMGGLIKTVKTILTKNGEPMAFVGLEDTHEQIELIVFPKTFAAHKDDLVEDALVLVAGKVSKREGEDAKLLVNSVLRVDPARIEDIVRMLAHGEWTTEAPAGASVETAAAVQSPHVFIALPGSPTPALVEELRGCLRDHPGILPVQLRVASGGKERLIETDYRVDGSETMLERLSAIVGSQNVGRGV